MLDYYLIFNIRMATIVVNNFMEFFIYLLQIK
jgi:hypothetical protein